jgi:hypothetical protein
MSGVFESPGRLPSIDKLLLSLLPASHSNLLLPGILALEANATEPNLFDKKDRMRRRQGQDTGEGQKLLLLERCLAIPQSLAE